VIVDEFSRELCGGTHVKHTGEIGPFVILSEGSVAAGVRRIEALTGRPAIDRMIRQQQLLERVARDLRVSWSDLPAQIESVQDRLRSAEREIQRLRGQLAGSVVSDLVASAQHVDGVPVVVQKVSVDSKDDLRQVGDRVRDKLQSGVIVLGAEVDGRPSLLAMVTSDVVKRGVKAGDLVREIAPRIEGRGGGRPELAEAGGKNAAGLDDALQSVPALVRSAVQSD
jgi:alanyl-tRNA synthetase